VRSVFWALLILNVAVFFWWRYVQPPRVVSVDMSVTTGGKRLLLLNEVNIEALQAIADSKPAAVAKPVALPPPSPTEPVTVPSPPVIDAVSETTAAETPVDEAHDEPAAEQETPEPTLQCYSIGPFVDGKAAAKAEERLKAQNVSPRVATVSRAAADGFMVFLPPFSSRQEAKKATEALAEQGETDYFVVPSGDNENAVSLGLYREEAMAQQRANQIAKKGFMPKVAPRMRDKTEFWLKFQWLNTETVPDDLFQQLSDELSGIRAEKVSCEQSGV
jgi:hypothetical protein